MLNILLDGKQAVIKKGSNFELVAENSRFDKSDSYTLDITFPLKDCPENIRIFGYITRKDVVPSKLSFDCDIIDKGVQMIGTAIITEYSEAEVKCQFLEGRSGASLTSPLSDIYINEIEIAAPDSGKNAIAPRDAWMSSRDCVALPWVNNDSGIMQNKTSYNEASGAFTWSTECIGLSWMPYLSTVIEGICDAIGYSIDMADFYDDEQLKYLLVCNALPASWDNPEVAVALPHWTVEQFFDYLEDFLFCEFKINHISKSVTYISAKAIAENTDVVEIKSDINEFSAEVFVKDSECKAIDVANIAYQESDHQMQKRYDCNWLVKLFRTNNNVLEYDTLKDLMQAYKNNFHFIDSSGHRNMNRSKLYYIKDEDSYYALRTIYKDPDTPGKMKLDLQPINEFGARIVNESEDARKVELKFVPACIDITDMTYGYTLFNSPGSTYGSADTAAADGEEGNHRGQIDPESLIVKGEQSSEQEEFYDRIYLGWWDGKKQFNGATNPFPNVFKSIHIWNPIDTKPVNCDFSLSGPGSRFNKFAREIDTSVKYNIKFLADSLPDPKAIFLIKGRKFICEKLTANINENGMSSLIKGIFWSLKA